MLAAGRVAELILLDGLPAARILCPSGLIPSPGAYLLAHAVGSDAPLATPVFPARSYADGFLAIPPVPAPWSPGTRLSLRGPLGRGFKLPASARRVALIGLGDSPRRLLSLLDAAFQQDASVVLVCQHPPEDLPSEVEVQPLRAVIDVCRWADYSAFDVPGEALTELKGKLGGNGESEFRAEMQILVGAPMPCGGLAACGVCTVHGRREGLLACEDGPVFDFKALY